MSQLSTIVNDAKDTTDQEKQIKEALELLTDEAKARTTEAYTEIELEIREEKSQKDPKYPVCTTVVNEFYEYRVKTATTNAPIEKLLEGAKRLFNGDATLATGITDLLTNSVNLLLGTSAGNEQHFKSVEITVEGASIYRYDLWFWARSTETAALRQVAETVVAVVAVKSIVDVPRLKFITFLGYINPIFNAAAKDDVISPEQVLELIADAKKIYKELGGIIPKEQDALTVPDLVQEVYKAASPARISFSHETPTLPLRNGMR